jgi:hypothetical protein
MNVGWRCAPLCSSSLDSCAAAFQVIMACRSKERGQKAATALLRSIKPLPGCGSPTVEVMELDLASLAR